MNAIGLSSIVFRRGGDDALSLNKNFYFYKCQLNSLNEKIYKLISAYSISLIDKHIGKILVNV